MTLSRIHIIVLAVLACGLFVLGVYVGRYTFARDLIQGKTDVSEINAKYKFIDPLLFCEDQNLNNQDATNIQNAVTSYIAEEKGTSDIIDAAFYFKDLNGGPSTLVNPGYRSAPSSLLKVPLAISVYQHAEQDPTFLNTKITMPADLKGINANQNEHFTAPESIQPNTVYTVEDLVRFLLEYSDNTAVYMIGNLFTAPEIQGSYTNLGLDAPSASGAGYTETVKQFASFFRVLYSATYLTQENSEHLLSLLSKSTFTQGIVAGVPPGTIVAHKFGETSSSDGTVQLNDCGVVYKPDQPYLICVMTTGTNYDSLATVISHISKMVYDTTNTHS